MTGTGSLHRDPEPMPLLGKTVLANGGGIGHRAVQFAKWKGAHIIAVASGKNDALMRDLGVDQFIDYTKTDADEVVRDVDLVLDAVGGAKMERFLHAVKRGGALFLVNPLGFTGHEEAENLGIVVPSTQVRSNGKQLAQAARLLDDGTVRVVLDSTSKPADASRAHERANSGSIQGKVVLTVV